MTKCAVLTATLVIAISGPAWAGVYVGLGVGMKPVVNDAMADVAAPSGRSLRGLLGLRLANLAVEGGVNRFGVATADGGDQQVYQASAALKLSVPLVSHVEGFARGGVERTWLGMGGDHPDLQGDGFLVGGGLELRVNAVIASMSVFVDYTVHHASLDSALTSVDATSQVLGVGVTVGL